MATSAHSSIAGLGFAFAVLVTLQGCGGPGENHAATTTTTTTSAVTPSQGANTTTTTTQKFPVTTTTSYEKKPVTTTPRTTPVPGPPSALVAELNAAFSGWNPDDDSSPLGVLMRQTGTFDHDWVCDEGCKDGKSDCRLSSALYNSKISISGTNMLFAQGTKGGFIYKSEAMKKLVRCSYGADAGTDGRVNHGCGCASASCGKHPMSLCPNSCENVDPQTGGKCTATSSLVTRCECKSEDQHVNEMCYWKGPVFYNGQGSDNTRSMVKQKYKFMQDKVMPYTEVIVDLKAFRQMLAQEPSEALWAFMVPLNARCNAACRAEVYKMRDEFAASYGVKVPVVGLDVMDGHTPFRDVEQSVSELVI